MLENSPPPFIEILFPHDIFLQGKTYSVIFLPHSPLPSPPNQNNPPEKRLYSSQ